MRLLPVGRDAILAEVSSVAEATALYAAARDAGVEAREIVPAARTVLFDGITDTARAWLLRAGRVAASGAAPGETAGPRTTVIPTTYGGPDLEETAALLGLTVDELVARHTGTTFTVAFCGFAPGFAYCTGLEGSWELDVPRLASPRPRVEPGSVGLAGAFTGVYPSASPGGWRVIGHTDVRLWDSTSDEPALLRPGTVVRFEAQ